MLPLSLSPSIYTTFVGSFSSSSSSFLAPAGFFEAYRLSASSFSTRAFLIFSARARFSFIRALLFAGRLISLARYSANIADLFTRFCRNGFGVKEKMGVIEFRVWEIPCTVYRKGRLFALFCKIIGREPSKHVF